MTPLRIGWAEVDTTPAGKVDLWGQYYHRLSEGVHLPLSATVLALDRKGGRYHFRCVHCCARLIVHARPAKAQQEAHFSAIARLETAPTKDAIVGAIQRGELREVMNADQS